MDSYRLVASLASNSFEPLIIHQTAEKYDYLCRDLCDNKIEGLDGAPFEGTLNLKKL